MKARKGTLNRVNVAQATGRGKRYVEQTLLSAKKLSTDEDRKERLEKSLCLSCFYLFKARIGGAAMTQRDCAGCDKEMHFSSTSTDMLCLECAKFNCLCLRCGADVELKERRNPYPFQEK
jgi:predicted  nucleic acid-binding Zn ribbon protein